MKSMEAYSAAPVELFQIYWTPICNDNGYNLCHKHAEDQPVSGDCSYGRYPKTACRKVIILVKEAGVTDG